MGEEIITRKNAEKVVKKRRNRPDLANFGKENVKKGDNAYYLRHALTILNLPPIDISDATQVSNRIDWYFNHCMEKDIKPTVLGLCNSLGISRDTINNWHRGDNRKNTHTEIIKKAYRVLEALWEDYMMNGKINPVSGIFLGRNHWGYQDKIDLVVTPQSPLGEEPSPEDLFRRIEGTVISEEEEKMEAQYEK